MPDESGYSSHLPVLEKVAAHVGAQDVIEYGVGMHSTLWLLDHCRKVTSVELNREWLEKVDHAIPDGQRSKWTSYLVPDERTTVVTVLRPCDLILVDGGNHMHRKEIAQACMSIRCAKAIIAHDAERMEYDYDDMYLPSGWMYVRIEDKQPWTAVMTMDDTLVTELASAFKCTVCRTPEQLRSIPYPSIAAWTPKQ